MLASITHKPASTMMKTEESFWMIALGANKPKRAWRVGDEELRACPLKSLGATKRGA
jgi:hypothetical protein